MSLLGVKGGGCGVEVCGMAVSVMPYAGCVRVSDTRGRQGKANFYSPEEQRQGILEAASREGVEVVVHGRRP